jgi:hypothetical protein
MVFRLKQSSGFSEIPSLVQIDLMPMVKGFLELASGAFRRKTSPGGTRGRRPGTPLIKIPVEASL